MKKEFADWICAPLAARIEALERLNQEHLREIAELKEFAVSLESELNSIRNILPPRIQQQIHPLRRRVKWSEFREAASRNAKSVTIPSEES